MRILLILLASLVFIIPSYSKPQEREVRHSQIVKLTLADSYKLVLDNNVDIYIERNNPLIRQWLIVSERAVFDPVYNFGLGYTDSKNPVTSLTRLSTRLTKIDNELLAINTGLNGLTPLGTEYNIGFDNFKNNGTTTFFRSEYDSAFRLGLTQPLLRNFGFDANVAGIRVAKLNKKVSDEELRSTLMNKLAEVQNKYWELVFAVKDLEVRNESLELAKTLLRDNKKRVEVGVLPPIEITQSEAGVASRQENVIIGEQNISDRENDLKVLLYDDPKEIIYKTIVPVDEPVVEKINLSLSESLQKALENRPDYLIIQKRINAERVKLKLYFNQKLPEVNFVGEYNLRGIRENFGNAIDRINSQEEREWLLGVEVNIPLGNRQQVSQYRISKLELKKLEFEKKKIELNLVKEIDSAIANINTNYQRVEATMASRKLAKEALDAEINKLETGTSTSHDVLQFQEELSRARAQEIRAIIDLNQSIIELYRVEGTILNRLNIDFEQQSKQMNK